MQQREFARVLRSNMTSAEQRLWRQLRAHRLGGQKFRRQQPLGPYVVDFVHFGARLIVEADGGQHIESVRDQQRDAWLRAQGFTVLRFWNNEILGNEGAVLEVIFAAVTAALAEKQPSPPAPLPQRERGAGQWPFTSKWRAQVKGPSHEGRSAQLKPLSPRGRGEQVKALRMKAEARS